MWVWPACAGRQGLAHHKIRSTDGIHFSVGGQSDEFEALANFFLGMARNSTDLLKGAWHIFLPAGNEEAGSSHSIIGSATQLLLLVDLLEQSLAAILHNTHTHTHTHTQGGRGLMGMIGLMDA